jgi:hypothetical protein
MPLNAAAPLEPPVVYVNRSEGVGVLVPQVPLTITSTVPVPGEAKGDAGETTLMVVSDVGAAVTVAPPKETVEHPVNPVPLMVTLVPPPTGPLFGVMPDTVGAAAPA